MKTKAEQKQLQQAKVIVALTDQVKTKVYSLVYDQDKWTEAMGKELFAKLMAGHKALMDGKLPIRAYTILLKQTLKLVEEVSK